MEKLQVSHNKNFTREIAWTFIKSQHVGNLNKIRVSFRVE